MKKRVLILGFAFVLVLGVASAAFALSGDKVQFSGYCGFRFDYVDDTGIATEATNTDLTGTYMIDDKTSLNIHANYFNPLREDSATNESYSYNAYAKTSIGKCNLTMGDWGADLVGYGLVHGGGGFNANVKGIEATYNFSNALKASLFSGVLYQGYYSAFYGSAHAGKYDFAEIDYKLSDSTNVKGVYHQNRSADNQYYEMGFDTKLPYNLSATVAGAQSSLDTDNTTYVAELQYGQAAFWSTPHSWDLFAAYHNNPANATLDGGITNDFHGGRAADFKGVIYGGHYVIQRMIMLTGFCVSGETLSTGADFTAYRLQLDFLL